MALVPGSVASDVEAESVADAAHQRVQARERIAAAGVARDRLGEVADRRRRRR